MAERQGFGGLMAIGKSRAKVYVETDTKVTFCDVAGVDEAKYEFQELVAFLRDPKPFGRLGSRIPKAADRPTGYRQNPSGPRSRRRRHWLVRIRQLEQIWARTGFHLENVGLVCQMNVPP